MSNPIIKVENLSKKYIIGHQKSESYSTLRESITSGVKGLFGGNSKKRGETKEEFWAVKNVSFDINPGDRVGIIGRNGAGKSTLLKILSRITEPSEGRITIRGRVASLLEVGTGFHPELSGRENIFLNGAILGMSRVEIRKKFDEIVAFAEVEKFLDTPVKRYSSGMYVRLAFAVAAHLEPEILIVDEVLAVGDAQFQKKCLGKMEEVSRNEHRTVLFVSHNMSTLKSLCTSIIYLKQGQLIKQGDVEQTIQEYLNVNSESIESGLIPESFHRKYKTEEASFTSIRATDVNGNQKHEFHYNEKINVVLTFEVYKEVDCGLINIIVNAVSGENIAFFAHNESGVYKPRRYGVGRHEVAISLNAKFLPLNYSISAIFAHYLNGTPIDWVEHVYNFSVSNVSIQKGSDYPWGVVHGYIEPQSAWEYKGS